MRFKVPEASLPRIEAGLAKNRTHYLIWGILLLGLLLRFISSFNDSGCNSAKANFGCVYGPPL